MLLIGAEEATHGCLRSVFAETIKCTFLGRPLVLLEVDNVLGGPAHQVLQQHQRLVEALQDQHEIKLGV